MGQIALALSIIVRQGVNRLPPCKPILSNPNNLEPLVVVCQGTHAAGLLLQELPAQESYVADWGRIEILANTVLSELLNGLRAYCIDCFMKKSQIV
jgi:hypothetical protein